MWPFDLSSPAGIVRVGRHAVERWDGVPGRLVRAATQAVERTGPWDAEALGRALEGVLAGGPARARLQLVVESAWLPVAGVEPGPAWRAKEVQALLRHRFEIAYRDGAAGGADWRILSDHRAGDRLALGYAMHPALDALLGPAQASGARWAGVVPAFAWGLALAARRRAAHWLVWPEQDRHLLAFVHGGAATAFNACADVESAPARIARQVAVECVRAGLPAGAGAIEAASWEPAARRDDPGAGLRWLALAAPRGGASSAPPQAAQAAGEASS